MHNYPVLLEKIIAWLSMTFSAGGKFFASITADAICSAPT